MRYSTYLSPCLTVLIKFQCAPVVRGFASKNNFQFPWSFPNTPQNSSSSSPSSSSSSSSGPLPEIEIQDQQVILENGISAQVLTAFPSKPKVSLFSNNNNKNNKQLPPLVFLHGSFHAAWCWSEKFFPYFVRLGYPVVALSWRGTGGTPAGEGVKKVKAAEHCDDLNCFLKQLPSILGKSSSSSASLPKPILLSHSFGGIVVMKYLETYCSNNSDNNNSQEATSTTRPSDLFSGIITMCSVPPSGNGKMTMRFLKKSWSQSWKITAGFAMKKSITDASLCRELFFGGTIKDNDDDGNGDDFGVSDDDIARYQSYFARDTAATIDLLDLAKKLPSKAVDDMGRAPFYKGLPPCLVIGATDDFIVDLEGNIETSKYYGLDEPLMVDSPHDVMLGRKWQNCADAIHNWIQDNVL